MNNSDYEINHSEIYNQIKHDLAAKQPVQPKAHQSEGKRIPIEKLTPFLESIQEISNHNLSVATHAQGQVQILHQQLGAEQSKSKQL